MSVTMKERQEYEQNTCPKCDARPGEPCDKRNGPRSVDFGVHIERARLKIDADIEAAYEPMHLGPAGRGDKLWLDATAYISFTLECGCSSKLDRYSEPTRVIEAIGAGQMRWCFKHDDEMRIVRLTQHLARAGAFRDTPRAK